MILDEYGQMMLVTMVMHHHLGLPYHGEPVTNATWHYRGTRALTPTGHARGVYYLPKKQLVLRRCGRTVVAICDAVMLILYRTTGEILTVAGLVGLLGLGTYRLVGWWKEATHYREIVQPLLQRLGDEASLVAELVLGPDRGHIGSRP